MKSIVPILLLALATYSPAFAQMPAKPQGGGDEQIIIRMENDWATALVMRDMAVIDRLEAPEYMFTDQDGSLSSKAQVDAEIKSGAVAIGSFKIDDLKVKILGDTAVVYGLETENSTYKGADTSGQYRFTDVFVKRNGTWSAVATHTSKVVKH